VREKALVRRLIETSTALIAESYDGRRTSAELLDHAEQRILQISQERGREGFHRIKELLWQAMERIEELARGGGMLTGVPSGFTDLDKLTLGFQPSELIIVAARPSMGKTAFVLNIAQSVAIQAKIPVAIFSLEMAKEQLVARMLAAEGYIDAQRLRNGRLSNDDFARLSKAVGILGTAPVWIDDTPGLTALDIRSRARRLQVENNVGLVIVDYLQLMQGPPGSENRQQEISYISRSLKTLARELRVPVVALSQLSRAPEQRSGENRRPQLSDLRESGAIEQDADVVMFLYRREYYEGAVDERGDPRRAEDGTPLEGLTELIIGKQRNGPTDTVRLFFHKAYTRFDNFSPRQPT
jgi:replicative DNA helicase